MTLVMLAMVIPTVKEPMATESATVVTLVTIFLPRLLVFVLTHSAKNTHLLKMNVLIVMMDTLSISENASLALKSLMPTTIPSVLPLKELIV